jgi:hypothetical protein
VCRTEGKGKCDREGVTYEIKCNGCDSEYIGETAYTRGVEHLQALEKKNERSVLWRHCEEKHDNEIQEFKMNVTGMYNNDAMARQIAESVRISKVPEAKLMNTREEWNFFQLPRAVVED